MKFLKRTPKVIFSLFVIIFSTINISAQTTIINQNFESDNEGWSFADGWRRTDNNLESEDGFYLRLNDFSNYANDLSETVTSGTIDLSGHYNMVLEIDVWYNTEQWYDGFYFQYSADGGSTWNTLGSLGEGINWYNDSDVDALGYGIDAWSGDNGDWETASMELPSELEDNSSVQFRAVFKSSEDEDDDGVAFDNFIIKEYPTTPSTGQTYYVYGTNVDWEIADNWTTDPSDGSPDRVNPAVPGADDFVVIYSGITVNINSNDIEVANIEVNGTLDIAGTSGHSFTHINGNGTIRMSGNGGTDNFPTGYSSDFTDATTGGTVEIYGTDIELDEARFFNNLNISRSTNKYLY